MTAIRTSQQNAYEGTLAAEMGPNDLAVIVDSIGTLSTPCYLVIEMDSNDQREYIFFDGSFTSTTFVTTNISKRYLSGSAAGSNLTHPAGTKIRTYVGKQHHDDLHDRIDGLSHDDLANLGADDHPHYALLTYVNSFDHHTKYTPLMVIKSANEFRYNDSTLSADDELLFAVAANEIWEFGLYLQSTDVGGKIKHAVLGPSGCVIRAHELVGHDTGGTLAAFSVGTENNTGIGRNAGQAIFNGFIKNGATPGNCELHWAQNVPHASNTEILANSYLIAHKIS